MLSEVGAKVVAMCGLGGGSFVCGVLPLWFHSRHYRWPLLMSALLCFGAGVLLATAMVHMLPEVRESLGSLAEQAFCGGFFLLYFVDEIVHFCLSHDADNTQVMLLVGAVACHKLVVAVCLGVELAGTPGSRLKHVVQVALFAGGCAGGIGIGMGLAQIQDSWTQLGIPLLQAIAGGTLLYVTVCEVLPRERAKWHHQTATRVAGIMQFCSVIAGFGVILVLNIFFVHERVEVQPTPGKS